MGNVQTLSSNSECETLQSVENCGRKSMIQEYFPNNCKLMRTTTSSENKLLLNNRLEKLRHYKEKMNLTNISTLERKLPEEMIIHILEYLPIKSLLKLQRVSKNFNNYWTWIPELWKNYPSPPPIMYLPNNEECLKCDYVQYQEYKQKVIHAFESDRPKGFSKREFKVVVLGDAKCGKTFLQERAINQIEFKEETVLSVGNNDFYYNNPVNSYYFHSFDCCGKEIFKQFIPIYQSMTGNQFYCFDLNNRKSYERAKWLYNDTKEKHPKGCVFFLGLKSDLEHKVTRDEIRDFLETIEPEKDKTLHTSKVQYFELSSKLDSPSDLFFPFIYGAMIATAK